MSNNKDTNWNADTRKKDASGAAVNNLSAGKGIFVVSADHVSGETCAQTIARATK